jgi:TolB protein
MIRNIIIDKLSETQIIMADNNNQIMGEKKNNIIDKIKTWAFLPVSPFLKKLGIYACIFVPLGGILFCAVKFYITVENNSKKLESISKNVIEIPTIKRDIIYLKDISKDVKKIPIIIKDIDYLENEINEMKVKIDQNSSVLIQLYRDIYKDKLASYTKFGTSSEISSDIYLTNLEGTKIKLELGKNPEFGVWSPDMKYLAFQSDRDGNINIYKYNLQTEEIKQLTKSKKGKEYNMEPSWSPDGKKIVFCSNRERNGELYIMDSNGTNQIRLTNTPDRNECLPTLSPDGKKIAYSTKLVNDPDKGWDLWIINADGKNAKNISDNKFGYCRAHWSPDGKKLAYVADRREAGGVDPYTKQGDIIIARLDENYDIIEEMNLTKPNFPNYPKCDFSDHFPDWSPDGKQIIFSSTKDYRWNLKEGNWEVYIMDANGKNRKRIGVKGVFPDWP